MEWQWCLGSAILRHAGPQAENSTPSQVRSCGESHWSGIVGRGELHRMPGSHGPRCWTVGQHRCNEQELCYALASLSGGAGNEDHRIAACRRLSLDRRASIRSRGLRVDSALGSIALGAAPRGQWGSGWSFCTGLGWGWYGCAASDKPALGLRSAGRQRKPCCSVTRQRSLHTAGRLRPSRQPEPVEGQRGCLPLRRSDGMNLITLGRGSGASTATPTMGS
jgi:hypothetical protein